MGRRTMVRAAGPARGPGRGVRYDFEWRFRHDWVRDGMPWFVFPAHRTEAGTRRYNQEKLRYVRERLAGTDKGEYLRDILAHVVPAGCRDQAGVEAVVRFVQGATWHNPLECPFEADERTIVTEAHELLELHDARCWHAAEILRQLFIEAGLEARVVFLPHEGSESVQVVAEVFLDGVWRVTDANYFEEGVILRAADGSLPTLEWLRRHPHHADRFPGGWIFPPEFLVNAAGLPVKGQFHLPCSDAPDTWGSDPYYCYYLGAEERTPPTRPAHLRLQLLDGGRARLTWPRSHAAPSSEIRYEATVLRMRDGAEVLSAAGLRDTTVVVDGLQRTERYEASVRATDEHRTVEPETWYPRTVRTFTAGVGD